MTLDRTSSKQLMTNRIAWFTTLIANCVAWYHAHTSWSGNVRTIHVSSPIAVQVASSWSAWAFCCHPWYVDRWWSIQSSACSNWVKQHKEATHAHWHDSQIAHWEFMITQHGTCLRGCPNKITKESPALPCWCAPFCYRICSDSWREKTNHMHSNAVLTSDSSRFQCASSPALHFLGNCTICTVLCRSGRVDHTSRGGWVTPHLEINRIRDWCQGVLLDLVQTSI